MLKSLVVDLCSFHVKKTRKQKNVPTTCSSGEAFGPALSSIRICQADRIALHVPRLSLSTHTFGCGYKTNVQSHLNPFIGLLRWNSYQDLSGQVYVVNTASQKFDTLQPCNNQEKIYFWAILHQHLRDVSFS